VWRFKVEELSFFPNVAQGPPYFNRRASVLPAVILTLHQGFMASEDLCLFRKCPNKQSVRYISVHDTLTSSKAGGTCTGPGIKTI
jgi:hypothetical protein